MREEKRHYLKLMLTLFTSAALAILFYFLLSNLDAVCHSFNTVIGILMPFIIGGVIAYILTPICNFLEGKLRNKLQAKKSGAKIAGGLRDTLIKLSFTHSSPKSTSKVLQ